MSCEQLPVDLEHAIWYCAHASLSGFTPDDDARKASDAIRAEHAQRVTQQHNAADLAQEIEDLRFAAEATGRRIAELEAERDELRARLAEIEAQEPAAKIHADGYWTARRGYDPLSDGKAFLSVYARPVTARAVPDGWRLAPVEPTPDMLDAARSQSSFPLGVYRAMIAAAPEHKSTGCCACGDACAKRGSCRLADESPEAAR